MAQVVLAFEGKESTLDTLPNTYDKLTAKIKSEFGLAQFSVSVGGVKLTSSNDLLVAYLNNLEERLVLTVDEDVKPISYVDANMQSLFDMMIGTSEPKADNGFRVVNGALSLPDLKAVLQEVKDLNSSQMVELAQKLQEERLRFYKVDEDSYNKAAMQQMQFQAMLQISNVSEVMRKRSIDPQVFERSMAIHQNDIQETMAGSFDDFASSGVVPAALTKEKFREVLEFSSQFSINYLESHPNITQMDFAILKLKEADEVYQQFGFLETEITAAFKTYNFDTGSEWDDIKAKLTNLQAKIMHLESGF